MGRKGGHYEECLTVDICGSIWRPVLPGPLGDGVEHISDDSYPAGEKAVEFIY